MNGKTLLIALVIMLHLFGASIAEAQLNLPSNTKLHSKLKLPISITQTLVTLKEFETEWEKLSDIELILDEATLAEEGITLDTLVSAHLENVSAESVLKLTLRPMNLGFYPSDGKLIVSSLLSATRNSWGVIETKVYPIGDLIVNTIDATDDSKTSSSKGTSGSYIESLVLYSFEEFSWKEFGGSGTVRFHAPSQSLIIRQHERIHAEIEEFLNSIRSTMNQQIRVELQLVELQSQVSPEILKLNGQTLTDDELATLLRKSDPEIVPESGYRLGRLPSLTLQNGKVAKFKHNTGETRIAAVLVPGTNQVKLTVSSKPQLGLIEDFGFTQTVIADFGETYLFVISQPYFRMSRTLFLEPRLLLVTPKKHNPKKSD